MGRVDEQSERLVHELTLLNLKGFDLCATITGALLQAPLHEEQIMALGIVPDDLDSATKDFADPKVELEKEKAAREMTQDEDDMLTWGVKDIKIFVDKFAAQVPILEEKVKHIENKVIDGLNEVRAKELNLDNQGKGRLQEAICPTD
jgi:DNA-directed RNA polymerase specialized sigma54-like protein